MFKIILCLGIIAGVFFCCVGMMKVAHALGYTESSIENARK
jgi:hypothetical protein